MARHSKKQDIEVNNRVANGKGFIRLSEAADKCNYSQEYLSLLARRNLLKAEKIGRNWFTKTEWLKNYIEDHPSDLKGNIKGKFISKNTDRLIKSEKKLKKDNQKSFFKYFKDQFRIFFVFKNIEFKNLLKKFILVSCIAGLFISILLNTNINSVDVTKLSKKTQVFFKEYVYPLPMYLKNFVDTEINLAFSGFNYAKETVGEELFGNTVKNISGAIYGIYNISTDRVDSSVETNSKETFLAGGFQKIAGAKDQQKYLNFFTKATEVKNISQNIAKDWNRDSSVKKYFAKLDKKILDTKFVGKIQNMLSDKELNLAVKMSLEEIFDLKFFEIGSKTEEGLTVVGNIALKGVDMTGNALKKTPRSLEIASEKANKAYSNSVIGLEKFSAGIYNITVKPIVKLGEWIYKQPINLAKSLGLKMGESRNSWLDDYVALQDSYLYLLKQQNKNKGGQTTIVYEGDYVVHQTPGQSSSGEVVYIKGPKGDKGEHGEKGDPGINTDPSTSSGSSSGDTFVTNIYNVGCIFS